MNENAVGTLRLARWRTVGLLTGGLAAGAGIVGWFLWPADFYQSYLFAYLYWWEVSLGMLAIALLYQMVGGRWGYAARPFFDSGAALLPGLAVAFLPLAFGLEHVYVWTRSDYFASIPHSENRQWYLQQPFFLGRAVSYLLVCCVFAVAATWKVVQSDGTMPRHTRPRFGGLAAAGLAMVVSLAAVDWVMSLEPEWYSTMVGFLLATGAMLSGMCVAVAGVAAVTRALNRTGRGVETALHDLGKLLLAFLLLWAYISFSQFLIIYSGNMPVETIYYAHRVEGGWQWMIILIAIFHFALPFAALLSRRCKTEPLVLAGIATGILIVHALDVYWTVVPAFHKSGLSVYWLDVVLWIALGGLWLGGFAWALQSRLLPVLDHWPEPPWLREEGEPA